MLFENSSFFKLVCALDEVRINFMYMVPQTQVRLLEVEVGFKVTSEFAIEFMAH